MMDGVNEWSFLFSSTISGFYLFFMVESRESRDGPQEYLNGHVITYRILCDQILFLTCVGEITVKTSELF